MVALRIQLTADGSVTLPMAKLGLDVVGYGIRRKFIMKWPRRLPSAIEGKDELPFVYMLVWLSMSGPFLLKCGEYSTIPQNK